MSPARHADMESVRERLLNEFLHFFLPLCRFIPSESLYFSLLATRFNRQNHPVLRGYYMVLIRRYIEEETHQSVRLDDEIRDTVLPFVAEVLMTVMYYDNQIFDKKAGVIEHSRQCQNILQSNILLAELCNYIEARIKNQKVRYKLLSLVRDVYEVVNIGQEIEQQCNRYENWKKNEILKPKYRNYPVDEWAIAEAKKIIGKIVEWPESKLPALEVYLERIYLVNAYLFVRFAEFLLDFSQGRKSKVKKSLQRFAGLAGMMLQIVNDICDFVPSQMNSGTHAKGAYDAMSDLKNRNVTLPTMLHLVRCKNGKVVKFLRSRRKKLEEDKEMEMTIEMLQSKTIKDTQTIAIEIKKRSLEMVSQGNPEYRMIKDMVSVANGNKYYSLFTKIYNTLK